MAPLIAGRHCRRLKYLSFNSQSELFVLFLGFIPPSGISSIQNGSRARFQKFNRETENRYYDIIGS